MSTSTTDRQRRRSFFDSFRIVAAAYVTYRAALDEENPIYDTCPHYCPELDARRSTFCEACPIQELKTEFKEDAAAELEGEGSRYSFEYLYRALVELLHSEGMDPAAQTVTTARLRAIMDGECSRFDRVKHWNTTKPKP